MEIKLPTTYITMIIKFLFYCILREYDEHMTYKVTTIRLPIELVREIDLLAKTLNRDKSDIIREAIRHGLREIKIRIALEQYQKGLISIGRLVEVSGLSYWEVYEELKKRGITLKYGEERFIEEVRELLEK